MGCLWAGSGLCASSPGEHQWTPAEQDGAVRTMSLRGGCQCAADGGTRAVSLSLEVLPFLIQT